MATTAGALTQISVGSTVDSLSSAVATGGTGPYTYQWYRSTTSSFSPGSGSLISGATSLTLNDSGLTPGTEYYYKVVATDSGSVAGTSSQLAVTTLAPSLSQNQQYQTPFLGMLDQAFNYNTLAAQIDATQTGTLIAGTAVKFTTTAGGLPKVVACTAASDAICGFLNFSIKDAGFAANQACNVSMAGNVVFLYASLAVNRGQFVTSLPSGVAGGCNGGVVPVTGDSGYPIVGFALDTAAIGSLVRIQLMTPCASYQVD